MNQQWDFSGQVEQVIRFCEQRDWKQFHYPKDLATALSIEASELQELFLWKGMEPSGQVRSDPARMEEIADEVADIGIYLLLLANELDINLKEAIDRKIAKNAVKYPV